MNYKLNYIEPECYHNQLIPIQIEVFTKILEQFKK